VQFVHRDKRVRLEVQWRGMDNPVLLAGIGAYSGTQDVSLSDGLRVRTLATDDLFA
jgi:hypothetical protein